MSTENEAKKSFQEDGKENENLLKVKGTVSRPRVKINEKDEEEISLEDEYAIEIVNGEPRRVPVKDKNKDKTI